MFLRRNHFVSRFTTSVRCMSSATTEGGKKKIVARYTDQVPVTLFRIYGSKPGVVLREYAAQQARGLRAYDLVLGADGLVHPAPLDDVFIGPNGASLRPRGTNMWDLLIQRRGATNVMEIPEGTKLPQGLVLLHEHGDHYSLQCTTAMTRKALEKLMNQFFVSHGFTTYSKEEFFNKFPLNEL